MKIVTILGARPQFIKAAPFSEVFRKKHSEVIVHTGQHYDKNMSDIFFKELSIPEPDYNLNIGSKSHGAQTGRMIEGVEDVLLSEKPDGLLVYGDTNSTLAGAIAASKMCVPIFHVEAGLRSYNKKMPEEQNRIMTDHISDLLFCPTQNAVDNLSKEGVTSGVFNTGDIMYDAVIRNSTIAINKYANMNWIDDLISNKGVANQIMHNGYYLATIHRAENTDDTDRLVNIFEAFNNLDKLVILPIHPRTKKVFSLLDIQLDNIVFVDPVGYLLMLSIISNARMVITDSGGLQKEAYFLGVPCTTLRDQTEWIETLSGGWNRLSEISVNSIISTVNRDLSTLYRTDNNEFGDGNSAIKICDLIESGGL